ncbi:LysE family transporter, partial [Pseudomonas aeruginosa]
LTLTPGLDTALVLRTAAVEGGRKAMRAGGGIVTGVLIWGLIAALGLGAVLAVSRLAYTLLQIAGAAYLLWLGWKLISGALKSRPTLPADDPPLVRGERWFL